MELQFASTAEVSHWSPGRWAVAVDAARPAAPGRPVWMTATRRLDLGLVFHCDRQPCSAQDGLGIGQFDERQASQRYLKQRRS